MLHPSPTCSINLSAIQLQTVCRPLYIGFPPSYLLPAHVQTAAAVGRVIGCSVVALRCGVSAYAGLFSAPRRPLCYSTLWCVMHKLGDAGCCHGCFLPVGAQLHPVRYEYCISISSPMSIGFTVYTIAVLLFVAVRESASLQHALRLLVIPAY